MPHGNPDTTDPLTRHGVLVETEDDQAMREMAECFVEEFIRIGFDRDRLLRMFRSPAYAGPFLAYRSLGEKAISAIIDEQTSLRDRRRSQRPPGRVTEGGARLPVLDR